jgi:hypothetical protein
METENVMDDKRERMIGSTVQETCHDVGELMDGERKRTTPGVAEASLLSQQEQDEVIVMRVDVLVASSV